MAERDDNRNNNAEGAGSPSAQERRAAKPRPSVKDKQRKREARHQRPYSRTTRSSAADSAGLADNAAVNEESSVSAVGVPGHPEFKVIRSQGSSLTKRDVEYGQSNTVGLASYQRRRSTGFPSSALVDDIADSRELPDEVKESSAAPEMSRDTERSDEASSVEGETAVPSIDDTSSVPDQGDTAPDDAQRDDGVSDDSAKPAGEDSAQAAESVTGDEEHVAEEDLASDDLEVDAENPAAVEEHSAIDEEIVRQKRKLAARRAAQQEAAAKQKAKRQHRIIACVTLAVVLVTVALLVSWQRWWQCDDAADMQGQWVTTQEKGVVTVSIDERVIHLRDDVGYVYTIDPVAKTIVYTFGDKEGHGRYWFSADRDTLVIVDGDGYTAASTFFEDVALWWSNLMAAIQGEQVSGPSGSSAIRLSRTGGSAVPAQTTTQQAPRSGAASDVGAIVEVPPSDDNASAANDIDDGADYAVDSYVFDDFDYDDPVFDEGIDGYASDEIIVDEGSDEPQDDQL